MLTLFLLDFLVLTISNNKTSPAAVPSPLSPDFVSAETGPLVDGLLSGEEVAGPGDRGPVAEETPAAELSAITLSVSYPPTEEWCCHCLHHIGNPNNKVDKDFMCTFIPSHLLYTQCTRYHQPCILVPKPHHHLMGPVVDGIHHLHESNASSFPAAWVSLTKAYKVLDKAIKKPCCSHTTNQTPTPRVETEIETPETSCCSAYHSECCHGCSSSPVGSPTSCSCPVCSSFDNSMELGTVICQISAEADEECEDGGELRHFVNTLWSCVQAVY